MDYKSTIINYIKRNKVSTTEVADCLGKSGVLENIMPVNSKHFCVGEIFYTYAVEESNWILHKDLAEEAIESKIVFVDAIDTNGRAIFGDLVSKYALLYKQASAIITTGLVRDAHSIIKEDYPIWCKGRSPVGCFNTECTGKNFTSEIENAKNYFNKSIAVCDDTGVVIISKENINEEFYQKLINIERQEDIWFDCIDRLKYSTFDTVCLKKYLEN